MDLCVSVCVCLSLALVLQPHEFVCMRMCAGTHKGSLVCAAQGEEVDVKTLQHLFSPALSYAQASLLGHMMSCRTRREDVGSCSQECVDIVGGAAGMCHP